MKTLILLSMVVLGADAARAASFADENVLGFFFDSGAGFNCLETEAYVTVPVHLVLVNPRDSALYGFEFGYSLSGSYVVQSTEFNGSGPIDVGGYQGNHIVGLASALTTREATVLATVSVFVLSTDQIDIDLHGAEPASIPDHSEVPALLLRDDEIVSVVLSTPEGQPNARINGVCNPETLEESWDGVKSLYQ